MRTDVNVLVTICLALATGRVGAAPESVTVRGGELTRAVAAPTQTTTVRVAAFVLDTTPVTNARFLAFVTAVPKWQRGQAPALFADDNYLRAWASPTTLGGGVLPDAPVTAVSWFAARAYCAWRGARLPTTDEWELAAMPLPTDAARVREEILRWYAAPNPGLLPATPHGAPNHRGLTDLHALIWEWTEDYDAAFVTADAREGKDDSAIRFCGGAAVDARNPDDYAAFMRVAFRSALRGNYALPLLGFRCARSTRGAP